MDSQIPESFKYIVKLYDEIFPKYSLKYKGKSDYPDFFLSNLDTIHHFTPFNRERFNNYPDLQESIKKLNLDPDALFELISVLYFHIEFTAFKSSENIQRKKDELKLKYRQALSLEIQKEIETVSKEIPIFHFNYKFDDDDLFNGDVSTIIKHNKIKKLREQFISLTTYSSGLKQYMLIRNIEKSIPQITKRTGVKHRDDERKLYLRILLFVKYQLGDEEKFSDITDFKGSFNKIMNDHDDIDSSISEIDEISLTNFHYNYPYQKG